RVAVLDQGQTATGGRVAERIWKRLAAGNDFRLLDRGASRAAADGVGYRGSLNLTLGEARDLGAALGGDFYLTGDAQVIRRSSSSRPIYYEAYASIFLVSTRSGKLLLWERPAATSDGDASAAENELFARLDETIARFREAILRADAGEPQERAEEMLRDAVPIEDVPDEGDAGAKNFRPPQPYRRLSPHYPESAARAEAEATVDAVAWIGTDGEVSRVEIVRWAGFGLDEETSATIHRMHFRPAIRDDTPVPVRALFRYNFRRPPKNQ
ncbi:MAG TPA: energy transducer TonB, partial [Pyrinomonadaceae bacterium]|nr:energy transducer TonB [Pyrinomonadaceae bacterium]